MTPEYSAQNEQEDRWAELARQEALTADDFIELLGYETKKKLPFDFGLFRISKNSVTFASSIDDEDNENMPYALNLKDVAELRRWEEEVGVLKLPCSPRKMVSWCERAEIDLPDGFIRAAEKFVAQGWGLAAQTKDYERALKQDAWSAREAICWLSGRHPDWCRGDIAEHFPEELDYVRRAIKAGKVTAESTGPREWAVWWQSMDWNFPPEMQGLLEKEEVSTPDTKGAGTETAAGEAKNKPAKSKVSPCFSNLGSLRLFDISLVMDSDKATFVIKRKKIVISPQELGLTDDSQGWKLLERAALYGGDFTNALKTLNKTNDREAEKSNAKTAICRLRNSLCSSMGLLDDPIAFTKGAGYKLNFNCVTHALIESRVTKGADAMEHTDNGDYKEGEHGDNDDFFGRNFNLADY
jgi:hypothetical protein